MDRERPVGLAVTGGTTERAEMWTFLLDTDIVAWFLSPYLQYTGGDVAGRVVIMMVTVNKARVLLK